MSKNTPIEIKLLADCKEHLLALAVLYHEQLAKRWATDASIERAEQKLLQHINISKLPLTLVALYDSKPVGMASLREMDGLQSSYAASCTPWLGGLVVDPSYQKNKIGERLINAIKQKAIAFGYKKLYLLAFDKSIPDWYTKLGWKKIGMDELLGHPVTVMEIDFY